MAKQHFFYNVMRKTIIQFLDIFNDIVIARYNQDTGAVIKYVKVPLKFAPKTKQWYWTELREAGDARDRVLPMIAVNLESVEYSKERQVNRNRKITFKSSTDAIRQHYNPVPYDFVFTLQIAAEYMVDITQIVEQIFPFFTPEAYVRITIPELNITGLEPDDQAGSDKLELRVVYESSAKDTPVELDEAGYRILLWTLTFRVQGYLFSPIYESKPIHNVIQNYYTRMDTNDTTDMRIGEIGDKAIQGLTYALNIPPEGTPIDDEVRAMYAYEHFEQPPNTNYVWNDNMVWIQDEDGNPVDDDIERHIRE